MKNKQVICDSCHGTGQFIPEYEDETYISRVYIICQDCNGTGEKYTKIEVGDRVRVYGWAEHHQDSAGTCIYGGTFFDNEKAVVVNFCATKIKIFIKLFSTENTLTSDRYLVHRKQCRKLVKKIRCRDCDGDGVQHYFSIEDTKYHIKCKKCTGTGKVKI